MTVAVSFAAVPTQALTRVPVTVRRRIRPRPVVDITRLTRYRGGTYSHTVDTVVFADGTSARTDLIRLNPGVEAYSLDFSGVAPINPSRYSVDTWAAVPNLRAHAYEPEVDWILRNSFPRLNIQELSRRVRAAGHPLGAGNIAEYEAIAATQSAIWHFTNGLDLDNRALNEPAVISRTEGGVVVEFEGAPELGGYTVGVRADAPATVRLEKSSDGVDWRAVAASEITVAATGSHRKTLGVGTTVATNRNGRDRGYRFYRVSVDGGADIDDVAFWLAGSGHYRNSERTVHLYNHLLAGAREARARSTAPHLTATGATSVDGLVGPFRLSVTHSAALTTPDADLIDLDGRVLTGPLEPGDVFYVRPHDAVQSLVLTATVPGADDGYGGRVLTGVARAEESQQFTPLALVVPAQLIIDFEIAWT
ncbi:thioester domain-containing protein [soil metagenome]